MNRQIIIITYISSLAILLCILIYLLYKKNHAKVLTSDKELAWNKQRNVKNHLYALSFLYMQMPIIRRYYGKIKAKYRALYPADEITLSKRATSRMSLCLAVCIGIFGLTSVICRLDFWYSIAGLLTCYIILTTMVNTSEEKMQMELLEQLDNFITDIHIYYHDTKMVEEALSAAMDIQPYEISLHAQQLYEIATAVDIDAAVASYVDTAPNRHLLLLAAICASVKKYGDKTLEGGKSLFTVNADYLKSDLDMERIRLKKRVLAFSGMSFSVLLPHLFLKPIEIFMVPRFDGTRMFYGGIGGVIALATILATTFICYEAINILKDERDGTLSDDRLCRAIADMPLIQKYLNRYTEHNYSRVVKLTDSLKATGYKNGPNVFMVKRLLLALLLFITVNVIAIAGIHRTKETILTDYTSSYNTSIVPNAETRQQMIRLSPSYRRYVQKGDLSQEELMGIILSDIGDTRLASIIANELVSRREQMRSQYYHWYILLLAFALGVAGYFIPYLLLQYKKKIMGMNREDEVAQFRTLILILMHEDGMTIDTILEWMERFAYAFKSSLSDCIINLEYSQQKALERLRDAEFGFAPFRRLCESLISTDKVGIIKAFDYLETERDYYQKKREIDNGSILSKCQRKAEFLMLVPIYEIIIFYILVPFCYYAHSIFESFSGIIA